MRALVLLLALAACAPSPDLDPDQAFARAQQAILDRDAETAHALLADAARQDHIPSLKLLLVGYDRGFRVPGEWDGTEPVTLPVNAWPGQFTLTGFRFVRALNRAARAGDPDARLAVALDDFRTTRVVNGEVIPPALTPAQRNTLTALYQGLADTGVDRFQLARLAQVLGDDEAYRRHVAEAAALGDPTACTVKVWFHEDDPQTTLSHTAGVARYLDRVKACVPDRPLPPEALHPFRDLRAQLALGNPAAAAALDSLRQLGVFERHPELAAVIGPDS